MLTRSLQRASLALTTKQALLKSSVAYRALADIDKHNPAFSRAHKAATEMRQPALLSTQKACFSEDIKKAGRKKNSDDPYEEDEFAKEEEVQYEH